MRFCFFFCADFCLFNSNTYFPRFIIRQTGGTAVGTIDANCTDTTPANDVWQIIRDSAPTTVYPRKSVIIPVDAPADSLQNKCITATLGTDGEIKSTFFAGLKTPIYVMSGSTTNVGVCFAPEGKSNLSDSQSKYVYDPAKKEIDLPAEGCSDANKSASNCMQCFE